MANNENENDAPQVYLLGKTYLASNQGQFYIKNDPIVHMASGDRHTIIVTESGRAFAFGDNSSGQLGLGHTNNVEKVSCIKSLKFGDTGEKVILTACGRESSLVATNHGTLYAFGSNLRSQLGIETQDANSIQSTPTKIEHFKRKMNWKQIAMGAEHACALTDDGFVYIWGSNDDGQCAQPGKTDTVPAPKEIRTDCRIASISCGYYHTALLDENGQLFLFGNNEDRQLGRSMPDKFVAPVEVSLPNKVKAVACGNQHTVVLTENGEVFTSGRGDRGQLGLGSTVLQAETFESVQGLPRRLKAVAAGEGHTVILGARGDMYVFGDGKHGKLGSSTLSNEFQPWFVDRFKAYDVLNVVCGGCQTIVLAKKKSSEQKQSSESEEDISNATLSATQRQKSRARISRNKTQSDRAHGVGDSIDSTVQHTRPLGASRHLRTESDDDKSDKELSESIKSSTFNQTHTITNGKFRPTQNPPINRASFRSNDGDYKPLKTGLLDRTVPLNKDTDDLTKANDRFPTIDKSPIRNTRFDRASPQPIRKKQDSDDEKSSSEEPAKPYAKKPERLSPPVRTDRRNSPVSRRKDDSESDDNKNKRPYPVKAPMSETLQRKSRVQNRSDDDDEEEEEEEDEEDNQRLSSRRAKQPPPTVARRSSLPPQTRAGAPISSTRDGNQTIGSKPVDGVRGSFRSPATKTLAKPNTTPSSNDATKKETTPAQQPGFFARLFGSKATPSPPPEKPEKSEKSTTTPATNTSSRTCSIM